jgi:hypothetical protein
MSDDPLAQFRGQSAALTAAKPSPAPQGREAYKAFGAKDNSKRTRLDIRCKDGMAHAVGYNFIVEICYDRRDYTGIVLVLTTMLIKIKGKQLRPIVDALKLGTCEFIQEFDAGEFPAPEGEAAPLVQSIEVLNAALQQAKREPE